MPPRVAFTFIFLPHLDIKELIEYLKSAKITPSNNEKLKLLDTKLLKDGISAYELLKRPEISIAKLKEQNLITS